jgi:AraC-like DNA-binding protein
MGSFGDSNEHLIWIQPGDLWQAILYHHPGTLSLNGFAFDFEAFDLVIVPPGSRCEVFRTGQVDYVYDYFSFIPVVSDRDVVALPQLSHLGDEGRFWDLAFRRALRRLQLSRTGPAATAYAMLWAVAEPVSSLIRNVYVERAEELIEAKLDQPLRIGDLAAELSISQSQLGRLFIAEHGRTPKQYIRERRAQLAHRLLTQTTLPVKQVAASCGVGDVHTFNRFVRDWLGASPRAVRAARGNLDIYRVAMYKEKLPSLDSNDTESEA